MRAWTWVIGAVALSSCYDDRPAWRPWQSPAEIEGPLRPEGHSAPATASQPASLRVVTFNVNGASAATALAALQANEAMRDADLWLLQEVDSLPGDPASRGGAMAAELGLSWLYAPARLRDDGGTHGLVILSRFPLSSVEVMELPSFELPVTNPRRIAVRVVAEVAGQQLPLVNVHLSTRLTINQRLQQLEPVVVQSPARLLLGGDLNTDRYLWLFRGVPLLPVNSAGGLEQAEALDEYLRTYGFATPTAELGPTFPLPVADLRLDSIFCRELTCRPGAVERSVELSDHHPVWVELEWPPAAP